MLKRRVWLSLAMVMVLAAGMFSGVGTAWASDSTIKSIMVDVEYLESEILPASITGVSFAAKIYTTNPASPIGSKNDLKAHSSVSPVLAINKNNSILYDNSTPVIQDDADYFIDISGIPAGFAIYDVVLHHKDGSFATLNGTGTSVTMAADTTLSPGKDVLTLKLPKLKVDGGGPLTTGTEDLFIVFKLRYTRPVVTITSNKGGDYTTYAESVKYASDAPPSTIKTCSLLTATDGSKAYFPEVDGSFKLFITEKTNDSYSISTTSGVTASATNAASGDIDVSNITVNSYTISSKLNIVDPTQQYLISVNVAHDDITGKGSIKVIDNTYYYDAVTPLGIEYRILNNDSSDTTPPFIEILRNSNETVYFNNDTKPYLVMQKTADENGNEVAFSHVTINGSTVPTSKVLSKTIGSDNYRYVEVTVNSNNTVVEFHSRAYGGDKKIELKAEITNSPNDNKLIGFRIRDGSNKSMNLEDISVTANSKSAVAVSNLAGREYRVLIHVPDGYKLDAVTVNNSEVSFYDVDGEPNYKFVTVNNASTTPSVVAKFTRENYTSIRIKKVVSNNANDRTTSFTFQIKKKDGTSMSMDSLAITANATDYVEYKLELGEYRVYELAKTGYTLSTVGNGSGGSHSIVTDGSNKYVAVNLTDTNPVATLVFNNLQDNVTTGFTLEPNMTAVRRGDMVTYTISGFGNTSGNTVTGYTLDIVLPQGMLFNSITIPALTGGSGITYDVLYTTNLFGDYRIMRTNLSASIPQVIENPPVLAYNEYIRTMRLSFYGVPAGFAQNSIITMNAIVAADAPASMSIAGLVSYTLPDGTLVEIASDASPAGPVTIATMTAAPGGDIGIVATGEPLPIYVYVIAGVLALGGIALVITALRMKKVAKK